ncbi:hypothetical protein Q8A73_004105 [Channa argus]|nr:hypothetical protein Q8A73_004105 [Channa argus]
MIIICGASHRRRHLHVGVAPDKYWDGHDDLLLQKFSVTASSSRLAGGETLPSKGGVGAVWFQVSTATSLLAGPFRSPLSGGLRMEVLIKSSHRSALSPSAPGPASRRIQTTERTLGQSRCHPAGVC